MKSASATRKRSSLSHSYRPQVTTTLWEEEKTLCYQVEVKGIYVARREDNDFINGTKLLNVAGMTRGRRDGILKSESTRHVVKSGSKNLKGIWISFERALHFAEKENIARILYPLFLDDIKKYLYEPMGRVRLGPLLVKANSNDNYTSPCRVSENEIVEQVLYPKQNNFESEHDINNNNKTSTTGSCSKTNVNHERIVDEMSEQIPEQLTVNYYSLATHFEDAPSVQSNMNRKVNSRFHNIPSDQQNIKYPIFKDIIPSLLQPAESNFNKLGIISDNQTFQIQKAPNENKCFRPKEELKGNSTTISFSPGYTPSEFEDFYPNVMDKKL
ncbi:DNA-binding domain of Mlu1-box binding protein MBP1 [Nadsonia fulvescens var. elongata DSM 6958]|uniref:DNA-binding domain of Mlu1-box binding protein MBP1 n=1 Tax=Nadsonia fulvescens var. elongata DSM 6958 TaxID=857566 RepID=A0A1E3PRW6_9ASCO|nr:DNA-binding domain of Mlu1-box binding protein MBP1 [Nadsonia fulvescens var. elongata DSM 6958]